MARFIGIDLDGEVYQNVGTLYREISPSPMVCEAVFDPSSTTIFKNDLMLTDFVFREDIFDPTTRIRRGRFYVTSGVRPSRCGILPRTREDYETSPRSRDLFTFMQHQPQTPLPIIVALGSADSCWRIAARPERISTGEFLFTLKAKGSFGAVPEIDQNAIPGMGKAKVIETLDHLADAAHRESPGSIIDRARDAAQWCLATWAASEFGDVGLLHTDLGQLIQTINGKRQMVALRAAEIVQRLHSRVKPNEQERYGFRPPTEADAELAVNSVGFLIRELDWASE